MLSIIIDNSTTDAQLLNIVTKMAPLDNNYPTDTAFRLLCSPVNPSAQKTIRVYRINSSGSWEFRPLENVTV
jgi:tRNA A37 threonylcarbamoyladenosine synthetase subunit TsaC/SUA5/YrdC